METLEQLVAEGIQFDAGELEGQPSLESLVTAGAVANKDYEKGFWDNTADATMSALQRGAKAAWGAWQKIGQASQEYKRQYEFLTGKTTKGGDWDPTGERVLSDVALVLGGMLAPTKIWPEDAYKEYAKHMEENPLDLNKQDSWTDKIFNRPVEAVKAELKYHYFLNPDDVPSTPDSFMDAILNPSKMTAALIDTAPMMASSMGARMMKHAPLANAIIFAFEMDGAYDEAYEYLMANDVAQGKMGPEMAMKEARDHAVLYATAATALEAWQQETLIGLGAAFKAGITNVLAGRLAKEGVKHTMKSFTWDAAKKTIMEILQENSQGTTQEMLQYFQLGKEIEGGAAGFRNRRGIEAAVMIGMMGLPIAGSASLDIANGPVQRSDSVIAKDVKRMADAIEHFKAARKPGEESATELFDHDEYMVPPIISRYQVALEKTIEKVFGKKVVWYSPKPGKWEGGGDDVYSRAQLFDGFASPTDSNVIMMNTMGRRSLQNVGLHESVHQLRVGDEEGYSTLKQAVLGFIRSGEYMSEEIRNMADVLKNKPDDAITEEVVAEVLGRLADEPAFMDRLTDTHPTLVAKFGRQVNKIFKKTLGAIGGRSTRRMDAEKARWVDAYITDMDGLMTSVLTALKTKAVRDEGGAAIEEAEAEVQAAIEERQQIEEGVIPEPKKPEAPAAKPEPEPSAQDMPTEVITERPAREITEKTADQLYMDYVEATRHPDMTPETQQRLLEMVNERGRIEEGQAPDVGLSAEEVSLEIDKYRPKAMQARSEAAQAALKEGKGVVVPKKARTKAEQGVERRQARRVKALAARKPFLSMEKASKGHLVDTANRGLSENTLAQRFRLLKTFGEFLSANNIVDVNDVTADVVRNWVRSISRRGLKASTVNQYVKVLKGMWSDMKDRGQVGTNPFDGAEIAKETERAPKIIGRSVVQKVTDMIPKDAKNRLRDIALIKVLFSSGMRVSEAAGAGLRDLSTTAGAADVVGKGAKERRVRFSPEAAKALDEYVDKERPVLPGASTNPYVFLSAEGKPLTRQAMRNIIRKHFKEAGITITTHELRHSFAVDMMEHGMDIRYIQELLGHEDIRTTAKYLHMSLKHLRKAIEKLHRTPTGLKPAMRKLTAQEKRFLGNRSPVTKNVAKGLSHQGLKGGTIDVLKGWITKAGELFPLGPSNVFTWNHRDDIWVSEKPMTLASVMSEGTVRLMATVGETGTTAIAFETGELALNADNISQMTQSATAIAGSGPTNVTVTLYDKKGNQESGQVTFQGRPNAPAAVRRAIGMAQGTLSPAVNREAWKRWRAHEIQSTENYKRKQEKRRKERLKQKRSLVQKLRREVKKSERAYKAGIRDAKKQLKQYIKEGVGWRKKFADYVNKNLPIELRGKLNKVIASIKDEKDAKKSMDRLVKEMDRLEKARALGRLKKWVTDFGKKYGYRRKQGYKKGMRFKISTPFSEAIESLLDSINLRTPRDRASLEELLEYAKDELEAAEKELKDSGLDKEKSTNPYIRFEIVPLIEKLEKKLNSSNVKEWEADEIDALLETLDIILGEWEYKQSELAKIAEQEIEEETLLAQSEIQSGHKKPKSKEAAEKAYRKGLNRYASRFFWKGLFGRFNYNIQTLVRIMGGMKEGALYSTLVNELFIGRDNEKSHVFQAMDLFQRRWKEAGFTEEEVMSYTKYGSVRGKAMPKKLEAWFAENMPGFIKKRAQFIPTEEVEVTLDDGQLLIMTVAEALSLLMHTNNEFSYKAIKKSGIVTRRDVLGVRHLKDEDFDKIREAVPKKTLKMLPILAEVMEFQQDAINEVSERLYGYSLANVDNYWHMRRFELKGARGKKGEPTKQTIESRSHFKERVGGDKPLYIDDAFNELVDTVRVGAEFVGLAEPMQRIRRMTNNPDIQRALLERGYGDYFKDYVDQIDSIQEHNVGLDWWEKLYGAWARNITRSVFGLNPRISVQQYASVLLATSELGVQHLRAVRGKYDARLRSRMEKNSPMLRERFMGAITRELGDVSKTGGVMRFMTGRDQLLNIPTFMVRAFDMLAVMDVWRMSESWAYDNYKRTRVRYSKGEKPLPLSQLLAEADTLTYEERVALDKKRGTSTADFMEMVVQKAEGTIRISQPTWDIVDRSRIGSVRNPMVKALTMFHSQREKMAQMIGIANSKYMNELEYIRRKNNLENLKAAATTQEGLRAFREMARVWGTIVLNTSLVKAWGALYASAIMGRPDEPEKILANVVADIPGMYYFGDTARGVISSLAKRLQGEKTYQLGAYEPPPLRVVTDAKTAAYEMGSLIFLTMGVERAKRGEVEKQLHRTLERTWESANSMLGLPFQHPTDVGVAQFERTKPKKRKGRRI